MDRPLIGITTAVRVDEKTGNRYYQGYAPNIRAIEQAGGLPMLIPCELDTDTMRAIYERVDAILLPGGGDIDPSLYGAEKHPQTNLIDLARDTAEIAVTRWAVEDERPLFAICRGHQVVNVALGGSLLQDIPSQVDTRLRHDYAPWERPRGEVAHGVRIEPDTRIAAIIGKTSVPVNSLHHQAVERVGAGLKVTAYSEDGLIEGLELPDKPFFVTVQWHPEDMQVVPDMQSLFQAFVEAARARRNAKLRAVG